MIEREHELPLVRQAELLRCSRGSLYYQSCSVSAADPAIMRRIDELHLEHPFAGSRMLRDLLRSEGIAPVGLRPPCATPPQWQLTSTTARNPIYRNPNAVQTKPATSYRRHLPAGRRRLSQPCHPPMASLRHRGGALHKPGPAAAGQRSAMPAGDANSDGWSAQDSAGITRSTRTSICQPAAKSYLWRNRSSGRNPDRDSRTEAASSPKIGLPT
jgi:putative transposase